MPLVKKALNYDLDEQKLKENYPNPKSYMNAWRDVKTYLCKNGFEPRQYSGVVSSGPMSIGNVETIIDKLNVAFPWLAPCVKKFDVTNVGSTYSLVSKFAHSDNAASELDLSKDNEYQL